VGGWTGGCSRAVEHDNSSTTDVMTEPDLLRVVEAALLQLGQRTGGTGDQNGHRPDVG
jgi:hypothetical protein